MKSDIILSGKISAELGCKSKGFKSTLRVLCREGRMGFLSGGCSPGGMFFEPGCLKGSGILVLLPPHGLSLSRAEREVASVS